MNSTYVTINPDILYGRVCPYCGEVPVLTSSKEIYGKDYGSIWLCRPCEAFVGVHRGTDKPLGRLADKDLRKLKKMAHAFFDPLWTAKMIKEEIPKHQARNAGYRWLASELGIDGAYCHIGMFTPEQCLEVVSVCWDALQRLPAFKPIEGYINVSYLILDYEY